MHFIPLEAGSKASRADESFVNPTPFRIQAFDAMIDFDFRSL
jgi:hypothetical protein